MRFQPPELVTHYARGEPFRSITAAGPERWPEIVAGLTDENAWGRGRFADPDYLSRRVVVEAELRSEFAARGGNPRIEHPHYAVVGRSARWERQGRRLTAHVVSLARLPADAVSFTFGDSLVCRHPANLAIWRAHGQFRSERCGRLLLLDDLADFAREITPDDLDHPEEGLLGALEVQLWIDPPADAVQVFPCDEGP